MLLPNVSLVLYTGWIGISTYNIIKPYTFISTFVKVQHINFYSKQAFLYPTWNGQQCLNYILEIFLSNLFVCVSNVCINNIKIIFIF